MTAATTVAGPSASEASAALIRIEGLVKHFGSVRAVDGVDLEVRPGEVFGFLGPNGSGKSTTIRCLLGLLRPTAGRISAFGLDPRDDGVAVRGRLAYVPGELRLPERGRARDLVATIGRLRGGLDDGRRDEIAERLRLDLDRPMRELSSGNRRKVALLLAFVADADVLVLDEPTSGLDPLIQHEFLALVREARDRGQSVFLSSHVLSEVQRIADRVSVLRAGRVVAEGTVAELRGRVQQRVDVWFEEVPRPEAVAAVPGLDRVALDGRHLTATLTGSVQPLVEFLARQRITAMVVEEPDLEEAFLDLYGGAE